MHLELQVRPTHVLNAAGVTGRPNVDWCESHKVGIVVSSVVPVYLVCLGLILLYVC